MLRLMKLKFYVGKAMNKELLEKLKGGQKVIDKVIETFEKRSSKPLEVGILVFNNDGTGQIVVSFEIDYLKDVNTLITAYEDLLNSKNKLLH